MLPQRDRSEPQPRLSARRRRGCGPASRCAQAQRGHRADRRAARRSSTRDSTPASASHRDCSSTRWPGARRRVGLADRCSASSALRAADRVRERRQPDAGARRRAAARARRARGARRRPGAAGAAAADREPADRPRRRSGRPGRRLLDRARTRVDSRDAVPRGPGRRDRHRRTGSPLHARRLARHRHRCSACSRRSPRRRRS